jgi:LacI family transcriptional regulator
MPKTPEQPVLFRKIAAYVEEGIASGKFDPALPLPSDMQLARRFQTSRPTVVRAMVDLQHRGLIERRAGSGTYVKRREAGVDGAGATLGILAAGLDGTEILNPICDEVCRQAERLGFVTMREMRSEGADAGGGEAEALVSGFIARGVKGVFFAPLERVENREAVNAKVVKLLEAAGIEVVLIDRDIAEFPGRSRQDLVGIDNFAAGYALGTHLAEAGFRNVHFAARPAYPSTTNLRMAGLREALIHADLHSARNWVAFGEPDNTVFVSRMLRDKPDAIVCSNDRTAALLMQTLASLGVRVPVDLGVAGFDDVRYATLLTTPLTTMHQPCRDLGRVAVELMASRLVDRRLPARSVQLSASLVVRASTSRPDA